MLLRIGARFLTSASFLRKRRTIWLMLIRSTDSDTVGFSCLRFVLLSSYFGNTALGFYTNDNRERNWDFAQSQGNHTITSPLLTILPSADAAANWLHIQAKLGSQRFSEDFTSKVRAFRNLSIVPYFLTSNRLWMVRIGFSWIITSSSTLFCASGFRRSFLWLHRKTSCGTSCSRRMASDIFMEFTVYYTYVALFCLRPLSFAGKRGHDPP